MAGLFFLMLWLTACGSSTQPPEPTASTEAPESAERPADTPSPAPVIEVPEHTPIEPLQVSKDFAPTQASGAVEGVPAATNTAPIVAIANFYADLPGIDMSSLSTAQREKFLHRANSELCTCGCTDDTLAKCYINDETCKEVKGLLEAVLEEIRSGT